MSKPAIRPEKINKPIQLLGAWLVGLFSIESCFLFAAANLETDSWEARALVVAAILNVPIFLAAVFLLQTRFRPELQEDSYYSSYLSRKTNEIVRVKQDDAHFAELLLRLGRLEALISTQSQDTERETEQDTQATGSKLATLSFAINEHLPDRQQIAAKLLENGAVGYSTFGTGSPAPGRIVSISRYLPSGTVEQIVALARDLNFESYSMFDRIEEEIEEDVLFGAYGDAEFKILRLETFK